MLIHFIRYLSFFLFFAAGLAFSAESQSRYEIKDSKFIDTVVFNFTSPVGRCMITPVDNPHIANFHGFYNQERLAPELQERSINKTRYLDLKIRDKEEKFTKSDGKIKFSLIDWSKSGESLKNRWHLYLFKRKPFYMNLNYGFGDAYLNLSGIPVKSLKLHSGKADITLNYQLRQTNPVTMDTMRLATEMGSIFVENAHLARARVMKANISFGEATINFPKRGEVTTRLNASVGAGSLNVKLPNDNTPVLIRIEDTMLSSYNIPEGYNKKGPSVFINEHYYANASRALIMNIEVSMGSVVFENSNN